MESYEIDHYIAQATRARSVTLFPRIFGRGLDLICHDPAVERDGGVHVVQSFLSVEMSEEVQIKGRTARQTNSGSYKLVVLQQDLKQFKISAEDIATQKASTEFDSMYSFLCDKRSAYCNEQAKQRRQQVVEAQEQHSESMVFVKDLRTMTSHLSNTRTIATAKSRAMAFVNRHSCYGSNDMDICFLMDCTSSMGNQIEAGKQTIRAISGHLKSSFPEVDFKFGFVAYRDHCDESSSWRLKQHDLSPDIDALQTFINELAPHGGGDAPEDIAGALDLCLKLPWSASNRCCLLVADAPCHGKKFHALGDNNPAGDPHGLDPLVQMRQLRETGIHFSFFYTNSCTDQMSRMFAEAYKGEHDGVTYEMRTQMLENNVNPATLDKFRDCVVDTVSKSMGKPGRG